MVERLIRRAKLAVGNSEAVRWPLDALNADSTAVVGINLPALPPPPLLVAALREPPPTGLLRLRLPGTCVLRRRASDLGSRGRFHGTDEGTCR